MWSKENGGEEMIAKLDAQKIYVYDEAAFKNEVCYCQQKKIYFFVVAKIQIVKTYRDFEDFRTHSGGV